MSIGFQGSLFEDCDTACVVPRPFAEADDALGVGSRREEFFARVAFPLNALEAPCVRCPQMILEGQLTLHTKDGFEHATCPQ